MRKPFHPLLLGTFLLPLPPVDQDGATPQTGTFGQAAPQSADVRLIDAIPHTDDHGGTLQQLVCAAGSKGGFALLWRDHREGMMGLYLGRFDHEGKLREPERPIHQPYAGRRLQPGLAVDPDGGGVALWTADFMNLPVLYAHAYDAKGAWQASDQPLTEIPQTMHEPGQRTKGVQLPAAAPLEGGGFAVAWTLRGALMWSEVQRDGTLRGESKRLNAREQQAEPGVQLCGNGKRSPLVVWRADGRLLALPLRTPKAKPHDLGTGTLVRSAATDDGGAWLLLTGEQGNSVLRVKENGQADGEPIRIGEAGEQGLDIAVLGSSLAVLVQSSGAPAGETPGRGRGGRTQPASAGARFQLRILDTGKAANVRALDFLSDKAKISGTPLIASDGARLLVAWTDTREGDADIYARLVSPDEEPALGAEFRANTDRASADQISYRVDAAGSHGIVTWVDKRDSPPRAYARRITTPGSFEGGEFLLPGQDPQAAPGSVAPAMRPDGSCAFLWVESSGALRLALLDSAGKPIDETRVLEPTLVRDAAIVALPAEQGWLCAWIGSEPAVWALRVDRTGKPSGEKQRVSQESTVAMNNLSLCMIGTRRLVLAWDANDGGWKIRGRLAGLDGAPQGEQFEFEGSPRKQDWDPALAETGNGGFVAAWTSGAPDDGSRDVVARFFDGQAKPSGPLLWISPTHNEQDFPDVVRLADGTWVVGWEDDISGLDHTYMRRIEKDQRHVGTVVRINELTTRSIQDRVAPRLVPFADGLLCGFGDRARSLGWDVRVRIVGPGFDVVDKR